MRIRDLDDLDKQIVYALQAEARHTSSSDIAEQLDVSASTVRSRIQQLEADGVIRGYHADVDYERAGFQLFTLIVCTAPIPEREELDELGLKVTDEDIIRDTHRHPYHQFENAGE